MTVKFKAPDESLQRNLMIFNVESVHLTINTINTLYFLLNINVFFLLGQITALIPKSSKKYQSQEFALLHLVVKQLGKLRTFSSKDMFYFITKTLSLILDVFIVPSMPIFVQWTYFHWFL